MRAARTFQVVAAERENGSPCTIQISDLGDSLLLKTVDQNDTSTCNAVLSDDAVRQLLKILKAYLDPINGNPA